MISGTDLRGRPRTGHTSTLAADLEEVVGRVSGVMTIYPAYPRWTVSHFADDRITTVQEESGWVVTIHIGVTSTSSANQVAQDVHAAATGHLRSASMPYIPTVEVKVCSIG